MSKKISKISKNTSKSKTSSKTVLSSTKPKDLIPKNNLMKLSFFSILFNQYLIEHSFVDMGKSVAELKYYKNPHGEVLGFINFNFDGLITLNRTDKKTRDSVQRITVGIDDKIYFLNDEEDGYIVKYVPKYQQEIKNDNTGLYDKNKEFGYAVPQRIKAINTIFDFMVKYPSTDLVLSIPKIVDIKMGLYKTLKEKKTLKDFGFND